jgi:hypothetical protein
MKKTNVIVIILSCFFCFLGQWTLLAQETAEINGMVLEKGTSVRIAQVNVRNERTKKVVNTDIMGAFKLPVQIGDSITLSKIGYETIRAEIKTFSDILLDLVPSSIRIEDVSIQAKSREQELRESMDSYRRQGVYSEGKPSVLAHIFSPLTSLYERFSRTGKNARRFRNYMDREMEELHVDRLFSKYKVKELTQLDEKDLQNFMFWYRPTFEESQNWTEYDLTNHVLKSLKKFEADGRPAKPSLMDL